MSKRIVSRGEDNLNKWSAQI